MPGPIAIDTPDYQRGVVSAQILLATVPAGTDNITVGIPPNAETLVLIGGGFPTGTQLNVIGTTSGRYYPGAKPVAPVSVVQSESWFFDVSSSVDEQVQVSASAAGVAALFIYADAGVHLISDVTNLRDLLGRQYVVPSVPDIAAGDRPPNELSWFGAAYSFQSAVLPTLPAGQQYRIFAAQLSPQGAGTYGSLSNAVDGGGFLYSGDLGGAAIAFPLTGLAMGAGNRVIYNRLAGTAFESVMVTYTTETI